MNRMKYNPCGGVGITSRANPIPKMNLEQPAKYRSTILFNQYQPQSFIPAAEAEATIENVKDL
jgi:hypothetical protein